MSLAATAANRAFLALVDQDGTTTLHWLGVSSTQLTGTVDISGGIAINAPIVGQCIKANSSAEYGLIELALP